MAIYERSMDENSNTKRVNIALVGASGKMGKALFPLIEGDPRVDYVEDGGDVVIDFSAPEGTRKAIAMGKPLVCGTTGLSKEIFKEMDQLAKQVPVLYSPNFSLGMALFFEILEKMGKKLNQFSTLQIEETHHTEKRDKPSGTALRLCELLAGDPAEIVSNRVGDVAGTHQVDFLFDRERLSIRHEAHSREAFAEGALQAAKFLFNKPAKLYSLSEIFD